MVRSFHISAHIPLYDTSSVSLPGSVLKVMAPPAENRGVDGKRTAFRGEGYLDPAAITRKVQDIFSRERRRTAEPSREDLDQAIPELSQAAKEFIGSLSPALADQTGHLAETYVAGAAAVAGSIAHTEPAKDQLLHFLVDVGTGMGLSGRGWTRTIPEHHRPTIDHADLLSRLLPAFDEAVAKVALPPRLYPFAAAFAALILIATARDGGELDQTTGKSLATHFVVAGAQTISPAINGPAPSVTRPQRRMRSRRLSRSYDFWSGHLDWLDPSPAALDHEICGLCLEFMEGSSSLRAAFTASLTMEDSYELHNFAYRAAIFGLRARYPRTLRYGLAAVSAVDPHAIDFRDASWPLGRLYYCFRSLELDAEGEFEEGARWANVGMSRLMRAAQARFSAYKSLEEFCKRELVMPVATDRGTGFVDRGIEPYRPTVDLLTASLRLAAFLRGEPEYQFDRVTCAAGLPRTWLKGVLGGKVTGRVPGVLGVCSIEARLRPGYDQNSELSSLCAQSLEIYLIEAEGAPLAEAIAREMEAEGKEQSIHLGAAQDSLAGIVLARSVIQGVPLFESPEGLERLRPPLLEVLETARPYLP